MAETLPKAVTGTQATQLQINMSTLQVHTPVISETIFKIVVFV